MATFREDRPNHQLTRNPKSVGYPIKCFSLIKSFLPMHSKIKQENEQKDDKPRNAKEN
jgi:hypothetical protein